MNLSDRHRRHCLRDGFGTPVAPAPAPAMFYGLVISMCREYFKFTPEEVSEMFQFEKVCAAYRVDMSVKNGRREWALARCVDGPKHE